MEHVVRSSAGRSGSLPSCRTIVVDMLTCCIRVFLNLNSQRHRMLLCSPCVTCYMVPTRTQYDLKLPKLDMYMEMDVRSPGAENEAL